MTGNCWKVDRWSRRPEPIEIVRETDKCYFYMAYSWGKSEECRVSKGRIYVFATWDEAKNRMVSNAEKSLEYAKQEVDRKRSELEVTKAMKKEE